VYKVHVLALDDANVNCRLLCYGGDHLVRKVTEGVISNHRSPLTVSVLSCYCQPTVAITVTTITTVTSVDITAITVTAVITTETYYCHSWGHHC
jgi:hypothetical protein